MSSSTVIGVCRCVFIFVTREETDLIPFESIFSRSGFKAADKRSIDIEINFDFRSAKINRAAIVSVDTLGRALANPDLKGMTFVLAGHTDAKGGLPYNQDLSEKRVDAVRRYLVDHFKLPSKDLVAVGYGKTRLKNENDPFGPENRRVQVVNMDDSN